MTSTPAPVSDPSTARRRLNGHHRTVLAVAVVLAAVVATITLVTSGHTPDDPSGHTEVSGGLLGTNGGEIPRPASTPAAPIHTTAAPPAFVEPFSAVEPSDPLAVMRAGVASMFTYLPGDSAPEDAARRAQPLIAAPSAGTAPVIAQQQWTRWQRERAAVTATANVSAAAPAPDTAVSVSRVITVTQRVIDRRGTVTETLPALHVLAIAARQPGGQWTITKVTVQQ